MIKFSSKINDWSSPGDATFRTFHHDGRIFDLILLQRFLDRLFRPSQVLADHMNSTYARHDDISTTTYLINAVKGIVLHYHYFERFSGQNQITVETILHGL